MYLNASNLSALISESERLKLSDSFKKDLNKYKRDSVKDKKEIKNIEDKIYSIKKGVRPFALNQWHITPLEALKKLCVNDSISEIRISFSDNKDLTKYFDKKELCSNLTMENISKYLQKDGYPRNIWRDSNFLELDNNKYIFENFNIYIFARDVNINNFKHHVLFRFISSKDINGYLFMNDKEKLKSFYLLNDKEKVHYGYIALDKVSIYSDYTNNSELMNIKYEGIKNLLLKKYDNYYVEDGSICRIGYPQSGIVNTMFKKGYIVEYYYILPSENIFTNYSLKLLKELEKNKAPIENDFSSQL